MEKSKLVCAILLACFVTTSSCSQTNAPARKASNLYVGSTPCDPYIKSLLNISPNDSCDFIKWELNISKEKTGSDVFELTALHGVSKPNTNGFIDGGKRIATTGRYTVSKGAKENANRRLYHLNNTATSSAILLVEMDDNIFHFANKERELVVGNGGWGYVLNRIK